MNESIELPLGESKVRFTHDGMVFIEDAIKALVDNPDEQPSSVWEKLKADHPGILDYCGSFATEDGELFKTIDTEGLDRIFLLLPQYI